MVTIIDTAAKRNAPFDKMEELWVYNGLDCCVTAEIHQEISPQLDENQQKVYAFERALQGPALAMMLRGVAVDYSQRARQLSKANGAIVRLQSILDQYANKLWGKGLNPQSPKMLQDFFYDHLQLPPVFVVDKGTRRISTNREALEQLENYFEVRPLIKALLLYRDYAKAKSMLEMGIGRDGRIRCNYNIGGTVTGRWSSSKSAFGEGSNLQNIPPEIRKVFCADPGKKLCSIDKDSAESYGVGWFSGDENYKAAAASGDPHTYVARLCWPNALPWSGDMKKDKEVADSHLFYRTYSYRYLGKRGGHASNYVAKPPTIAKHLHIPISIAEEFQGIYFDTFPGIKKWHGSVARTVQLDHFLVTPYNRVRYFFGRAYDDKIIREAVSFLPQSTIADDLNKGMLNVWLELEIARGRIELLLQVHDNIVFQYNEEDEDELVPLALEVLQNDINVNGSILRIPSSAEVGWNWGKFSEKNPNGLKKYKGHDDRKRVHDILDR